MKTKEQKVEELVEWVAKTLYEEPQAINYFNWETAREQDKAYYRRKAQRILSHPGLVLIDRDAVRRHPADDGVVRYIPLAEALEKEGVEVEG